MSLAGARERELSETLKKYYPYKSDRPTKKFYIITNDNKKVYFGAS